MMQSLFKHASNRAVLAVFTSSLLFAGIAIAVVMRVVYEPLVQGVSCLSIMAATLCMGWPLLLRRLHLPVLLEERIADITPESNAFQLREIHLASPLAQRWNHLVDLGRRWQTAQSLQEHLDVRTKAAGTSYDDTLLDALSDGIMLTAADGAILYGNPACKALLADAATAELVGQPWPCLMWSNEAERLTQMELSKARNTFDIEKKNAGGETRVLRCQRRSYQTGTGESKGHIWIVRDITQQRLAEEMRENFLSTATHELRTPLANIRAYAESLLVADEVEPESQKHFYNIIQTEAVRLSNLISDLLDVNRMQAGSFSLDLLDTDLMRLVEDVTKKVQAQADEKHLEFHVDISPKLPKVMLDKTKLIAALVNLLGNAMKYTPDHGRVSFAVDANAKQLEFIVTDTGIGIAETELPHIFDKFFRSDDERVRDIPGSGLGLSFTQEVARLHGGEIEVESHLNKGSKFRLTIPFTLNA
jgi:two-component system, OmpR family, phosphate regulon sensor histidine kinase PhoR